VPISTRSFATTVNPAAATTVVVNKPAGVIAGDVMYATVLSFPQVSGVHATSPGWTDVAFIDDAGGINSLTVLRKVAGGAEPATYTFTGNASPNMQNGALLALIGVNNTTPEDAVATVTNGASSLSVVAPSITTVTDNAWHLAIFQTTQTQSTLSLPPGYTNDIPTFGQALSGDFQRVDHRLITPAGASGTATSTGDIAGTYLTISLAIRPAADVAIFPSFARGIVRRPLRPARSQATVAPQIPTVPATGAFAFQKHQLLQLPPRARVAPAAVVTTVSATSAIVVQKNKVKRVPSQAAVAPQTPTTAATSALTTQKKAVRAGKPKSSVATAAVVIPPTVAATGAAARQKRALRPLKASATVSAQTPTVAATGAVGPRRRLAKSPRASAGVASAPQIAGTPATGPTLARQKRPLKRAIPQAQVALQTPTVAATKGQIALQKKPVRKAVPVAKVATASAFVPGVEATKANYVRQKRAIRRAISVATIAMAAFHNQGCVNVADSLVTTVVLQDFN
jgi:hypothetical protein